MPIIELAKSGRATCRTCKGKIEKGTPRIGVESVFRKDGKEYVSYKWHHFDCAMQKIPETVAEADGVENLSGEYRKRFDQLVESLNRSAFDFIPFEELKDEANKINIYGAVGRVLPPKEMEAPDGSMKTGTIVQLKSGDISRKAILWNSTEKINKGDVIYAANVSAQYGNDGNLVIHAGLTDDSSISINSKPQITKIEKFISEAWERPKNKRCQFTLAKSSRAICPVCEAKIEKNQVKIIQPIWIETGSENTKIAGDRSFHPECVEKYEHGNEILLEAITHLSIKFLNDHREYFDLLVDNLQSNMAKTVLLDILSFK